MSKDIERKIAVIFVTDVVGFSKMMEVNEDETLRSFRSCRDIAIRGQSLVPQLSSQKERRPISQHLTRAFTNGRKPKQAPQGSEVQILTSRRRKQRKQTGRKANRYANP